MSVSAPTSATPLDYNAIVADLPRFWGEGRPAPPHHPLFVREFAGLSLVMRDGDGGEGAAGIAAYLLGLLASAEPVGFIHAVGVADTHRRQGLASELYAEFARRVAPLGARTVRSITWPGNQRSLDFHRSLSFSERFVADYRGLGEDRFVFEIPMDEALERWS